MHKSTENKIILVYLRQAKERKMERITWWRWIAVKRIGRSRLKWKNDIREDLGRIKIRNKLKMAIDRQ